MDAKDYYSRKLRTEIDEHNALLIQIEKDMESNESIKKSMKAFVSAIFGNDGWFRLVEARWLRAKQQRRIAEYDPNEKEAVPLFVKAHYDAQKPFVPVQLMDELPTKGSDQFGEVLSR